YRADDRGETENGTEESLDARPLGRRVDVAKDGERRGEEHPAEEALDDPENDQLRHVLRDAAERGGRDKPDHPGDQERLAAEEVTELSGDRHDHRRGDKVAGDQP